MSAEFDPYHKWLGIPPAEQPPNLYRLLAIPVFETDADVIDGAADARMTHLRTFSAGKNGPIAQKLLNEISSARVTLLNPQARAAYDSQLQSHLASLEAARLHAQQAHLPPPMLPPTVEPVAGGPAYGGFHSQQTAPAFDIVSTPHDVRRSGGSSVLLLAVVGVLAVSASLGGLWYVLRGMNSEQTVVDNPVDPPPINSNINPPPPATNNLPPANSNPTNIPPAVDVTGNPPATSTTNTTPPATSTQTVPPATATTNNPLVPRASTPPENSSGSSSGNSTTSTLDAEETVELKGHEGPVLAVDFSADGKFAVSGGEDRTVRVWDIARRQATRLFEGMPSAVRCVRMSADGNYIAIACPEPDRLLRVWHVNRPAEAVDMRLEGDIESFEFTPDGSFLVAGHEGLIQVFNARTAFLAGRFGYNGNSTAISRDGRRVFAAGPGNIIRSFELAAPQPNEMNGSKGEVLGIALSGDDRLLVSGGSDRMLRLWDVQLGRQVLNVRAPGDVRSVALNHDGRRCVSLGERFVSAWDLPQRKQIFSRRQAGDCHPAISSEGRSLLLGDADGTVLLISLPALPPLPNRPPQMLEEDPPPRNGNLSELVNSQPREKVDPPSEAEIAEATKQLQEIYPKTETKSPEEQSQLADRLLQLAATSNEPADQYAFLQFAADLAQRGGDARLIDRAFNELASRFKLDVLPLKLKSLTQLAKAAKDEATIDSLVSVTTTTAEAGVDAGQLEAVSDLLDAVASACAKPAGRRHAKVIAELRGEVTKAKKPWAAAQLAKTKLEAEPDNAEAKTTLGIWTSFGAGDWSTGLPLLAQGSDEKLKTLAEQDQTAEQGGPREQLAAADAWYDASQSAAEGQKAPMLRRAGHWYTAVLPMVKQQIARLKIEGRLEEINKLAPSSEVGTAANAGELEIGKVYYVLGLADLNRDVMGGDWLKRKEAMGTEVSRFDSRFILPVELQGSYEFEFDFTAPQGQVVAWLPVGQRGCQLWIGEGQRNPISGLAYVMGTPADRNPTRTLMPKLDWTKRHTVHARVEQSGELATIEATFDGKPLLRWRGPHEQLAGDMRNGLRDPKQLGLGATNAPIVFHTAKVKLLEGSGKLVTSHSSSFSGR